MTTVALITKGDLRLRARITDISRHDCWHDPMFSSQFVAQKPTLRSAGQLFVSVSRPTHLFEWRGLFLRSSGHFNTELSAFKRRTRAEVQQLVAEFVGSGMRRSEFCKSRGLSFSTLDRHLKKRRWKGSRKPISSAGRSVPVELAARKSPTQHEDRRLQVAQTTDPLKRREDALRRDQARLTKSMERLLTGYQENLSR